MKKKENACPRPIAANRLSSVLFHKRKPPCNIQTPLLAAALLAFSLTACGYKNSDATDAPFPVGLDGVYGYVDQKGEWVIPPRFDAANPFTDDGTAWVQFEGRYGRIDRKGGWALQPVFEDVGALAENGLARAKDGNRKWGFINAQGEWVVPLGWNASAVDSAPLKWRVVADTKELLNARGDVVLVANKVCGVEVSKNPGGEITWPKKSTAQICEEKQQ